MIVCLTVEKETFSFLQKVMEVDKENESLNLSSAQFGTPGTSFMSPQVGGVKKTPIRPLTAAYKAARSENEVKFICFNSYDYDSSIIYGSGIHVVLLK